MVSYGEEGLYSMEDSSALVTRYPGTVTLWPFMKMCPWVIICLACLMVLASPFSKTMVWSLRDRTSSSFRERISFRLDPTGR